MTNTHHDTPTGRRGRGGRGRRAEVMVPDAEFASYYGRPVVKESPWTADIPAYLFLGGLAGASSLLAAGADLTGNSALRRPTRITAAAAILASFAALVHDLGKPSRFHHMLRVAKPTSPMSVGTWILTAYGPMAVAAAATEVGGWLPRPLRNGVLGRALPGIGRGAGSVAALLGPAVASYTAVLLTDTATPSWHDSHRELPFVFVGSAAAAGGGIAMLTTPLRFAGPAQTMAIGGAVLDLAMSVRKESHMGLTAEPMHQGRAGSYLTTAHALTAGGAVISATLGRQSRSTSVVAGVALLAGSICTRFGIFHAGQQSTRDPRYTVEPQRRSLDQTTSSDSGRAPVWRPRASGARVSGGPARPHALLP